VSIIKIAVIVITIIYALVLKPRSRFIDEAASWYVALVYYQNFQPKLTIGNLSSLDTV